MLVESSKAKRGDINELGLLYWGRIKNKYDLWLTQEKFLQYKEKQKKYALRFESRPSYRLVKRAKNKKYYQENIESERIRSIAKYNNLSDEKKLEIKERKRRWHLEKKAHIKASKERRRQREKSILSKTQLMTIAVFYNQSKRLSEIFGIKFHVDHIVPLNTGGMHTPSNLQVVPAKINLAKGPNKIFIWAEKS